MGSHFSRDVDLFKIVDGVEEAFSEITACLPPAT